MYPITVGVRRGEVVINVSPELADAIDIHTWADAAETESAMAVDIYCHSRPEDTAVAGTIWTGEGETLALALVYTAGESGWWQLHGSDASLKLREMVDEANNGEGGAAAILTVAAERAGQPRGASLESARGGHSGGDEEWGSSGRRGK